MPFSRLGRAALTLLALVASWHAIWLYGLPSLFLLAIVAALGACYLVAGPVAALLVSATLWLSTLAFAAVIELAGLERAMYYRPHEMLEVTGDPDWGKHYRPGQRVTMHSPYGDLQAIGNVGILEPREIEFVTDSIGFRNRADFDRRSWVLVGDSFIAGEGNTQACMLAEQLIASHGIGAYTLAHPGDGMPDYEARLRAFEARYGPNFRAALFVYEDNDFAAYQPASYRRRGSFRRYEAWLRDNALFRYTRWLYLRAFKPPAAYGPLAVHSAAGLPMAFLPPFVEVVRNDAEFAGDALGFEPVLARMRGRVEHVFFVPGKYRVYAPLLEGVADGADLPHRQWEYLQRAARAAGIPATDLTPALVARARELAPERRYVFWRDDSHWNCEGTAAAAREVSRVLAAIPAAAQSPRTHDHSFGDARKRETIFDDPKRDAWQKPHEVIQAMALK